MTFKSVNRKISRASIALLSALSLTGIAPAVNAESSTARVSNGEVTIHAQQASPLNPEDNILGPNDGTELTSGLTMANVTFTATPIILKGTSANGSFDSSDYDLDPSRTSLSQTTNATGVADFSGLTDGYYLFHQSTSIGGIRTIKDFIVAVNTTDSSAIDVNVYPKLDLTPSNDLQKIALTNAKDNFNGKTPDQIAAVNKKAGTTQEINAINASGVLNAGDAGNTTTAGAGDTITWNLNSIFDASQITNVNNPTADTTGTYSVKDTLPAAVNYSAATAALTVSVADSTGDVAGTLTADTDYTVTISGSEITVTLTTAGQLKAAGLLSNASGQINIQLPTTVASNFVGTAVNSVVTSVVNAFGVDISNSATKTASVNVGGVEIEKVNGANKALKGATFVLVRAKDEAAAKALVTANAADIKNDGSISGLTDNTTAEFVKDISGKIISRTTGDDGLAAWTGLNLVDSNTDETNATNYFAVEIQAPADYELPSPSTGANVFAVTADTTVTPGEKKITNNRPFDLPFTGGTGITAILILAAAAGIGAIIIRRRKNDEVEEISK
ncbi:SpaH/EbpB family LPXTG-anchored major pilin [Lactovum odontotermitis]